VFTYATWTAGCDPEPPPAIKILTQPAHGKAELRPGPASVRFVRQGASDCTGKVIPGLGVWYIPAPGFHATNVARYYQDLGEDWRPPPNVITSTCTKNYVRQY
jgi:hypothetical protein